MAQRYVLMMLGVQFDTGLAATIRRTIEDNIKEPRDDVEIDVWLESVGGDAHAAYKLALMLDAAAAHVRVLVPDFAKSAATLFTLVGHEIFMAPGAELGPLDAQLPEEGSLHGYTSALNIALASDEIWQDALAQAGNGGAILLSQTGLSRAVTLGNMLTFAAAMSEPLLRQLDPKAIHDAKQLLRVTATYAERLLALREHAAAERVAERLVQDFPTHGYVICSEEAANLGLPVRALDDYDLLEWLRVAHRQSEDSMSPMLSLQPAELFMGQGETDEEDDSDSGDDAAEDGAEQFSEDGSAISPFEPSVAEAGDGVAEDHD